ncbi:15454_t:CDS:2 [Funneliformis caledonium]|uniref:15454_t:CDS:1 n=1 Tax=Funneliformis caledonium TaxID=1117310 RepID=A0A9N9E897_9GLOM|nr:15454_t:CDS:2 [Funneliformis caledonium]
MGTQHSKKLNTKKSFANKIKQNLITSDAKYDSKAIDRIHSHHYLLKHIWKDNFSSPIRSLLESGVINALEVKCGPGTWILDMATDFPRCSFTGIDAEQIFPSEIKPKNAKFVLAEHLPFSSSTFSYVHINLIEHMYMEQLFWQSDIINDIIKIMKSDSWMEITTWNFEFENIGSVTQKLVSALISCFENHVSLSESISLLPSNCERLKNMNILQNDIPVGKWAGLIGELVMDDLLITFKGYSDRICNKLNITPEQYNLFLEEVVKEIEENQTVFKTHRFYGQKP